MSEKLQFIKIYQNKCKLGALMVFIVTYQQKNISVTDFMS